VFGSCAKRLLGFWAVDAIEAHLDLTLVDQHLDGVAIGHTNHPPCERVTSQHADGPKQRTDPNCDAELGDPPTGLAC